MIPSEPKELGREISKVAGIDPAVALNGVLVESQVGYFPPPPSLADVPLGSDQTLRRAEQNTNAVVDLAISAIEPNSHQPRQSFEQESLQELAASILTTGIIQPIIVRPNSSSAQGFQIVAGERRWRAAKLAKLESIPAIIRDIPDSEVLETALIENIQRQELNPMEEASAYQTLQRERSLSQEELAGKVGKQRSTVANMLRLLNLPKSIQEKVATGTISMGHARALLGVLDPIIQNNFCELIITKRLNVRQAEELVARSVAVQGGVVPHHEKTDPNVLAAEERLSSLLGTKVRIAQGSGGAGKIVIHYYSEEELDRHFETLRLVGERGRRGDQRKRAPKPRFLGTDES